MIDRLGRWMMLWLKPGIGLRRWLIILTAGLLIALGGGILLISNGVFVDRHDKLWFILLLVGWLITLTGLAGFVTQLLRLPPMSGNGMNLTYAEMALRNRVLQKGPNVVAIGGGTGMSALLRGLKGITNHITVVVTVADDGGGSGILREEMGILPPGDVRNCIIALSQTEPQMQKLLQYRFTEGSLKGQSVGNLLLAAMTDINGGFLEAVTQISDILAVVGRVLPVSIDNVHLKALMEDGSIISGESTIGRCQKADRRIQRVWLEPIGCRPLPEVLDAISNADVIVLGPGSLYTSLLPNLVMQGMTEAILRSGAKKVYMSNIMTQPGETSGYDAQQHLKALFDHTAPGIVQYIVVNNDFDLPEEQVKPYREEGSDFVSFDEQELRAMGVQVVARPLVRYSSGRIRHSYSGLGQTILEIWKREGRQTARKKARRERETPLRPVGMD